MNFYLRFKEKRGITLIALVVTIILLLVLAGISISMLTGENGIIKRASEAKETTENAQIEEILKVAVMEALSRGTGTIMRGDLENALDNNFGAGKYEISEDDGYIIVKTGNKSFDIKNNGKIKKSLPKSAEGLSADAPVRNPSSYGENAQATADGAGKYFAKPDGATYVTGTVDKGVVVNIKGSEFVWVPIEDVVLDTSRDEDLPKSSENGTDNGKTYTPMAVRVGNDYKGILYNFSGHNSYLKYGNNENYQGGLLDYREPDIVSSYDGTDLDTVSGKITKERLTSEYNEMIVSVLKYKGFYVARYEAGLDKTTNEIVFKNASVEANNVTTTDASNSETSSWYGLYKKIKTFTTDSDNVVSSMIWESQYDAMMNWMSEHRNTVGSVDASKKNTEAITGKKINDVINNVYDLYGCHFEWTIGASDIIYRSGRGGYFDNDASPAARFYYGNPDSRYTYGSSRATLIIK